MSEIQCFSSTSNAETHYTGSSVISSIGSLVLFLGVSGDWPHPLESNYKSHHLDSTHRTIELNPTHSLSEENFVTFFPQTSFVSEVDFAREISKFYANLLEGQEPLGAEFEAVWDENTDILYES